MASVVRESLLPKVACGREGYPLASVHVLVVEESSLPRITVSRVEIVRVQFGAWY